MTKPMQYQILGESFAPIIDWPIAGLGHADFVEIDLSVTNAGLPRESATSLEGLTTYVDTCIAESGVKGAWGGYGEKRDLYRRSGVFSTSEEWRSIHLGIDFWLPAGTGVVACLPGEVHSFANNDASGDYGPTIVLLHQVGNLSVYSLYGHLSMASLEGLERGQLIRRGQVIGTLGAPAENKDWPPHLHFQLIRDMEGKKGDYPGVCLPSEQAHYLQNCPDPREVFGWGKAE